jgi:hypothetical protein
MVTGHVNSAAAEAFIEKAAAAEKKKAAKAYKKTPKKPTKTCLKEGCGKILTGKQSKRCNGHHMQCAKRDCKKNIQNHDSGCCYTHAAGGAKSCRTVAASAKKKRVCLKEGCGVTLTGQQKTRCEAHNWMCAKKGCKKYEQSGYGGFCKAHFS